MTITAQSQFHDEVYAHAYAKHAWHRWRFWLLLRTLVAIGCLAYGGYTMIMVGPEMMAVLSIMVGTFALVRPIIWKILYLRRMRGSAGYGELVSYEFSPAGISMAGASFSSEVAWDKVYELVVFPAGVLIYFDKRQHLWLPDHTIAGETSQLAELARQNGVDVAQR